MKYHLSLVVSAMLVAAPALSKPISDRAEYGDGTAESTNWSGYAVTGAAFTSVYGSWVVPEVDCTGVRGQQYSAFWTGLDGYASNTVEQIGTSSECHGTKPVYYAWYEFYPGPSMVIRAVPVSPGHLISTSVVYNSRTNKFTVKIVNETTRKSYSTTARVYGATRSSAEWIAEAPCCTYQGGILPLADFGTSEFGFDETGVSGTNYASDSSFHDLPIGSFPPANVKVISKISSSSSPQTASCSDLSVDGTSFSCTWAP